MIAQDLKRVRRVGTPLVAIITADQPNTVAQIRENFNGKSGALLTWDVIRGYSPLNELGTDAKVALEATHDAMALTNFTEAMIAALDLPSKTCVLVQNGHAFLSETNPIQALLNLRDFFKSTERTIVLLGPDFKMPAELAQDILVLTEELPSPQEIRATLDKLCSDNALDCDDDTRAHGTDALRGLANFSVEQAAALSVQPDKSVSVANMWQRKRAMLPKGLTLEEPLKDSIGGVEQWLKFSDALFTGPNPPRGIFLFDEIEKSLAGAMGDTSGTSQDQHQELLTEIEDRQYVGSLFLGPPGGGKTFAARVTAARRGIPFFRVDLGSAKGSLVGESEQKIRAIMRAIYAIVGHGGAYFIATCNKLDALSPEIRRRLSSYGLWFFDMANAQERAEIGIIQAKRYPSIPSKDAAQFFASQDGWSGANIRDCCRLAHALNMKLGEAAAFVIPAGQQDPEGLQRLRAIAHNRFLSASTPGVYRMPKAAPIPENRKITSQKEA